MSVTQVDRLSVSMAPEVGVAVRYAAERAGRSVSNWLAEAAAQRLRNELLGAPLDQWEIGDGPFADGELRPAEAAFRGSRRCRGVA